MVYGPRLNITNRSPTTCAAAVVIVVAVNNIAEQQRQRREKAFYVTFTWYVRIIADVRVLYTRRVLFLVYFVFEVLERRAPRIQKTWSSCIMLQE